VAENTDEAIKCYDSALKINPDYDVALKNMAELSLIAGNFREAIKGYDKIIEMDPADADRWNATAYEHKGICLFSLREYTNSIGSYSQAITSLRDYLESFSQWRLIGRILLKPESESILKEQIIELQNRIGIAYCRLGKFDVGIEYFDRCIAQDKHNQHYYHNRGIALYNSKKYHEAIRALNACLEIFSTHPDKSMEKNDAGREIQKILIRAIYPLPLRISGPAASESEDSFSAKAHYLTREIKHDSSDTWFYKGKVYLQLENHDQALECFSKAIDINPDNLEAWQAKCETLEKMGKLDDAKECYLKAKEVETRLTTLLSWRSRSQQKGRGLALTNQPQTQGFVYIEACALCASVRHSKIVSVTKAFLCS
jgi:tetratricopeptide (TPR) repeat protein